MLFRLVLLFAIASGLIIFTWSNLQPIAITFLGIQTLQFPLALWVLGAIVAGILTTIVINTLFSISSFATGREVRSQFKQTTRSRFEQLRRDRVSADSPTPESVSSYPQSPSTKKQDDAAWRDWEGYEEPVDRQQSVRQPAPTKTLDDDWNLNPDDDWEVSSQSPPVDQPRTDAAPRSGTDYKVTPPSGVAQPEAAPQPKSSSQAGSVYSYGYRDPGESGVGRQEKVVDAEYRVIVPPYMPSVPPPPTSPAATDPTVESRDEEDAEDWFDDGSDGAGEDERWRFR